MAKKPTDGKTTKAGKPGAAKVARPAARRVRKTAQAEAVAEPVSGPSAKAQVKAGKSTQAVERKRKPRKPPAPAAVSPALAGDESPIAAMPPENRVEAPVEALVEAPPAHESSAPAEPAAVESAPAAVHDEELPHGLSPVDLPVPEEGEQPGLGWMAQILVLSSLLLVLFNSFAIDKWARSLPVNEYSGQIIDGAAAWHGMMDRIDFNLPLETGRSAWHWVKELQWPGGDQDDGEAAAGR